MLIYLDNADNRKRDDKTGSTPNENYARELLELQTLGVNSGYSQHDVQEVARCLTGWTVGAGFERSAGQFEFRAEDHDPGSKMVLGRMIPAGGGQADGEAVLEVLSCHPDTAGLIARKLCRRFVSDDVPQRLVDQLAEVFLRSEGDIRQVLSAMFHSQEFQRGGQPKFKRSFDYAVSALRALDADTTAEAILPHLKKMGQAPFNWSSPEGYPDLARAWSATLVSRWNFAVDLVQNQISETVIRPERLAQATGQTDPADVYRSISRAVLGEPLAQSYVSAMLRQTGSLPIPDALPQWLALLLAAPQFQYR
jgi:uncharacterized protein (DUF1800 family)